jgi:ferredoxin
MQIKVRYNNHWVPANPDYCQAYKNYKNQPIYHPEEPVTTRSLTVYRTNNDVYLPTYIRDGDNIYPIADFEDVRVFLLDLNPVDWYAARNYQIWAYYDFMYDNQQRKTYASKYSISSPSTVEIDIDGLPPNIIFSISRNENNSVYYERNDERGTRVRICDNHMARIGYRGFYTRMTMDVGMIVTPPPLPQLAASSLDGLPQPEQTDIEEEQCIMCYTNKKNITLSPCNHNIMCSACYVKLEKKNVCPVCRTEGTVV